MTNPSNFTSKKKRIIPWIIIPQTRWSIHFCCCIMFRNVCNVQCTQTQHCMYFNCENSKMGNEIWVTKRFSHFSVKFYSTFAILFLLNWAHHFVSFTLFFVWIKLYFQKSLANLSISIVPFSPLIPILGMLKYFEL